MLKGEVYLWSGKQMGGGNEDATIAKNALTDIQNNVSSLSLMDKFSDVFAYTEKEIKKSSLLSVTNSKNMIYGMARLAEAFFPRETTYLPTMMLLPEKSST